MKNYLIKQSTLLQLHWLRFKETFHQIFDIYHKTYFTFWFDMLFAFSRTELMSAILKVPSSWSTILTEFSMLLSAIVHLLFYILIRHWFGYSNINLFMDWFCPLKYLIIFENFVQLLHQYQSIWYLACKDKGKQEKLINFNLDHALGLHILNLVSWLGHLCCTDINGSLFGKTLFQSVWAIYCYFGTCTVIFLNDNRSCSILVICHLYVWYVWMCQGLIPSAVSWP